MKQNIKYLSIKLLLAIFLVTLSFILFIYPSLHFNIKHDSNSPLTKNREKTFECEKQLETLTDKNKSGSPISWQVSAPRGIPGKNFAGDVIELGLRNKYGASEDNFYVSVRVQKPNGVAHNINVYTNADEWLLVSYPYDFKQKSHIGYISDDYNANTILSGIYSVVYQVENKVIACDSFKIE